VCGSVGGSVRQCAAVCGSVCVNGVIFRRRENNRQYKAYNNYMLQINRQETPKQQNLTQTFFGHTYAPLLLVNATIQHYYIIMFGRRI
jgi:hypothetical protein